MSARDLEEDADGIRDMPPFSTRGRKSDFKQTILAIIRAATDFRPRGDLKAAAYKAIAAESANGRPGRDEKQATRDYARIRKRNYRLGLRSGRRKPKP